ncbi:MAG: 23S rRNA (guanosine(2251)-2'-O)-methyltransferase RlmB [Christensenellaceae bacterium]|jgi:23S rRNA (guanosine2251-2'-O)-methyltransferase|nr:23S rRNA (guanosine(2251)-2'-O)-methyltransferase RlmB [Christensenellaceae bacterium]
MLIGRNPIREALKAGSQIDKIFVAKGDLSGSMRELLSLARERHIQVSEVDRRKLDEIALGHQGIAAQVPMFPYAQLEDLFALAEQRGEKPFFVALDGITDPHNLGAVIRSCECMGAHGVILPERRSVGLTPAAVKASAGAAEWLKVAKVKNLARAIEEIKEKGVFVYAADVEGQPIAQAELSGAICLVVGAEGEGLSRLVKERCDGVLSIPLKGRISSLNASVAAGILLYEAAKKRCS